jgi:glutamate carboxypeptidase
MNSVADRVKSYCEEILTESLRHLESMVAINSHSENHAGVRRLGELTAEFFAPLGFQAKFIPSTCGYGDHLALVKEGQADMSVGFLSHLDTVFTLEEETLRDFHYRVREGQPDRIYGPGTVDIKGGTIVLLMAMQAMKQFFPEEFAAARWTILLDSSEEVGATDFEGICADYFTGAKGVLVFEGGIQDDKGNFQIVCARRGIAVCDIEVAGRAAHAGSAHQYGANAIVQLARVIDRMAAITDYNRGLTCNVGVVSGGSVINAVPDHALAKTEMRCFTPAPLEEAMRKVEAMAGPWNPESKAFEGPGDVKAANDGFPCSIKVRWTNRMHPWPEKDPKTVQLFDVWRQAAEDFLGVSAKPESRGGLSDANRTWNLAPTLDGLGPAGSNAHCSLHNPENNQEQEYALISSFAPKAALNALGTMRLLGSEKLKK